MDDWADYLELVDHKDSAMYFTNEMKRNDYSAGKRGVGFSRFLLFLGAALISSSWTGRLSTGLNYTISRYLYAVH